jgi:hypothetical protein
LSWHCRPHQQQTRPLPTAKRLELYPADLNLAVGDDASSRQDLKIRVAVTDAAGAHGLLGCLAALSTAHRSRLTGRSTIDPPRLDPRAMEKQMRADGEERATILNAEGIKH